jgi:hypothetical protein
MRRLFAIFLIAATASANELSVHSLQSGTPGGPTPIHDHGIHGEGQIIAILDTGLDWDNCFFAETDNSAPPVNTGDPLLGLKSSNVDPTRRKVIAYDFLYSCAQFPGATGCENPADDGAYDNQGHGTHAAGAAAGDRAMPIFHDYGDAIAPAAKLVVQDAGYVGGDLCTQRPGLGCPTIDLRPVLQQAYNQGARIHSNSWGDLQGVAPPNSPTGNYSKGSREIDDFVYSHPDMLVIFETGNRPGSGNLSAPGTAKNTIDTAGTRVLGEDDSVLSDFSGTGPTGDGRLKPELVAPAYVMAGDTDGSISTRGCDLSYQPGTSWAAPTLAGAAALVRQYFTDGFYPGGAARTANRMTPSAALLKATLIAAARAVPKEWSGNGAIAAAPAPSYRQGYGFPVLDDVLYFPGDRAGLLVRDVPVKLGLAAGASARTTLQVAAGTPLTIALVWTDPPGVARPAGDPTPELVNDLDLTVTDPNGNVVHGNEALHPGQPDRLNNSEVVKLMTPQSGGYTITVAADRLGFGVTQGYALVVTGDFVVVNKTRAVRH